jgi:hypothetical protein
MAVPGPSNQQQHESLRHVAPATRRQSKPVLSKDSTRTPTSQRPMFICCELSGRDPPLSLSRLPELTRNPSGQSVRATFALTAISAGSQKEREATKSSIDRILILLSPHLQVSDHCPDSPLLALFPIPTISLRLLFVSRTTILGRFRREGQFIFTRTPLFLVLAESPPTAYPIPRSCL